MLRFTHTANVFAGHKILYGRTNVKNFFTHFVLPLLLVLSACTTATPQATQAPTQTATPTFTATLSSTPTTTMTPSMTSTSQVEERFQPDEFFFIVLKDEQGMTVQTNDPVLETVNATTVKTHRFVDHVAQERADTCVGPTNKSIVINRCFIHKLPDDVTGFKAVEGEVVDFAGTAIFYNRATENDPWAVYFKALSPTATTTFTPSPTIPVTPTATLVTLTTLQQVLDAVNTKALPDTRFCSQQKDQFGNVVFDTETNTTYLISSSPCPTVFNPESKSFERMQPTGYVANPVQLQHGYKLDHAWVTEIPVNVDVYGISWTKDHIAALGLRLIDEATDEDGYRMYFEVSPPTVTPSITQTPNP